MLPGLDFVRIEEEKLARAVAAAEAVNVALDKPELKLARGSFLCVPDLRSASLCRCALLTAHLFMCDHACCAIFAQTRKLRTVLLQVMAMTPAVAPTTPTAALTPENANAAVTNCTAYYQYSIAGSQSL